jgi:hypothetical protein
MRRLFLLSLLLVSVLITFAAAQTGTKLHKGTQRYNSLWVKSFTPGPPNQFVTGWNPVTGAPTWASPTVSMLSDNGTLLRTTGAQKVAGLQVVPRECTPPVNAGVLTLNIDTCDDFILNAAATALTLPVPTGTGGNPVCNQQFSLRIKSSAARALTHNAIFSASGRISLPTTTTGDTTNYDYWLYRYNCDELKWNIIANNQLPPSEILFGELDGTPSGQVNSIKIANNGTVSITGKEATLTLPAGGGGGTGTVQLPVTGPALSGLGGGVTPAVIDSSLNNRALVFDSTLDQCALWDFTLPADYAGTPVWKWWYVKSGGTPTAGQTVRFDVSVMKLLTTASIETDDYDTAVICTDNNTQTAVQRLDTELGNACSLTSFDTAVAGNAIKLKVCHNQSDSVDGQIRLVRSALNYSK